MERSEISDKVLLNTIEALTVKIGQRIEQHGRGAYVSHHEMLGIVTEEYKELIDAVQSNDPVDVGNELMDVAVSAIYSIASMFQKEEELKDVKAARELFGIDKE